MGGGAVDGLAGLGRGWEGRSAGRALDTRTGCTPIFLPGRMHAQPVRLITRENRVVRLPPDRWRWHHDDRAGGLLVQEERHVLRPGLAHTPNTRRACTDRSISGSTIGRWSGRFGVSKGEGRWRELRYGRTIDRWIVQNDFMIRSCSSASSSLSSSLILHR